MSGRLISKLLGVLTVLIFVWACSKTEPFSQSGQNLKVGASKTGKGSSTWIEENYSSALKKASAENKPVLIDFYTDWCGWCKKLDRETYSDPQVQNLTKRFVCLKINADKSKRVAQMYRVNALPTTVFADSTGREVARIEGFQPAPQFAGSLSKVLNKMASLRRPI